MGQDYYAHHGGHGHDGQQVAICDECGYAKRQCPHCGRMYCVYCDCIYKGPKGEICPWCHEVNRASARLFREYYQRVCSDQRYWTSYGVPGLPPAGYGAPGPRPVPGSYGSPGLPPPPPAFEGMIPPPPGIPPYPYVPGMPGDCGRMGHGRSRPSPPYDCDCDGSPHTVFEGASSLSDGDPLGYGMSTLASSVSPLPFGGF